MLSKKLENLRKMDVDQCLFLIGNVFLFSGLIIGIILLMGHITIGSGQDCMFHRFTGLYCMGCGGTRSMLAFFQGDLVRSMKYNIFTTFGLTYYFLFMGSHYLRVLTRGRLKGIHFRMLYIIIAIILLVGHFIIRNIMLLNYGRVLWPVAWSITEAYKYTQAKAYFNYVIDIGKLMQ